MEAYDAARFDPAAPLALVTVRSEQLGVAVYDVPMLLDTGADVSLLPVPIFRRRLPPMRSSTSSWRSTAPEAPRPRSRRKSNFSARGFAGSSC